MKFRDIIVPSLLTILVAAGCSSTKVTQMTKPGSEKLARPNRIVVHDFSATAADLPADSAFAGQFEVVKQTPEQIATGKQLGALIAKELAADIKAMGLPGETGASGAAPGIGDIVIKGYFLSVDEGSAVKRVAIGFGAGGARLETAIEGYQMTAQGLRQLGSAKVESGAGKAPGVVVPAAVAAASGNPIGLVVSTAVKAQGEISGRTKIQGRAKQTADEIAEALKPRFQRQGWIN